MPSYDQTPGSLNLSLNRADDFSALVAAQYGDGTMVSAYALPAGRRPVCVARAVSVIDRHYLTNIH